jgi:hypothetical protein
MSGVIGQATRKAPPYTVHFATTKHAAICSKPGSDYASSPHARSVTCATCLKVMGENYLRNMEAAGLVPPVAP